MADEIFAFSSADGGAPVLTGEVSKLIDLLTACLVDGYATKSVSSITRSGTTATVTTGSAHGLVTGQMATIAGAVETDYNGRFIVTVSSSTVFTYQVANSPTTPATGTITARRASAGWDLPYSGTNKAVYRSPNNAGARHYFRFQDDGSSAGGAKEAFCRAYVSMSDVDTGSEPFPTVAQQATGLYCAKSITANSTARAWFIVADDKTCYIAIANGTNTLLFGFGHFESYKAGDAYNSFLSFSVQANSVSIASVATAVGHGQSLRASSTSSNSRMYCPRSYAQTGTSIATATYALPHDSTGAVNGWGTSYAGGGYILTGPATNADGAFYTVPAYVMEIGGAGSCTIRGRMPGIYAPVHAQGTVATGSTSTGLVGLTGRSVYHFDYSATNTGGGSTTGQILFDLTGPW